MVYFLWFLIVTGSLGIVARLIFLGINDYPRKRENISAWEDVFALLFNTAFIIWEVAILLSL